MRTGAARWLAVLMVLSWVGVSHAQVDLAIDSVSQVDGKWVANGRYGTPAGLGRAKIAIETSGKNVGLSWTGPTGNQFQLNLLQDKHLVGKVTLTMEQQKSGTGSRDRTLKLEKVN